MKSCVENRSPCPHALSLFLPVRRALEDAEETPLSRLLHSADDLAEQVAEVAPHCVPGPNPTPHSVPPLHSLPPLPMCREQEDAEEIPSSQPLLCADDLAEQVAEVARHFALADVTLMGVTAGAYVLTLFALSHRHLVRGLILVSPLLSPPSWSEWAHNKVTMSVLSFYGMTSYIKDSLLDRYFCPATAGFHGPASDALLSFRRELDYHEPENLMRYFYAIHRRRNLLPGLAALQVPVLVGVGDSSPFNPLARTAFHHLHSKLRPAGSHPWDCCEHAGEDGEERSGYGREWAVGHVEEGASVRWVPTSPLPPPSRLSSPRPPPLPPPPPPLIPPPPSARPSGPLRAPQQLCRLPSHLRLCHLGASWFLRILIEEKVGGGGGIADGV
ncbi:unnamed protein product [Closterium sp. NIES-65]|nr:unnamed protein product [Closterium sp. NIES-65]